LLHEYFCVVSASQDISYATKVIHLNAALTIILQIDGQFPSIDVSGFQFYPERFASLIGGGASLLLIFL
jgi:hypothetical protein